MRRILLLLSFIVLACPQQDKKGPAEPSTKCTRFGQTCEVSPGKLGTCVMRENCTEDCFVCQSQH